MQVGDLIRFSSTGCHGLVVKTSTDWGDEYVHVLCGPDADGHESAAAMAFPRHYVTSIAEVVNESR